MIKKKYTLQKKITQTFAIVFTSILLIATFAISVISVRVYWGNACQLCEQLVSLNLNMLENQIMNIQKVQENIAKNAQIREAAAYFCRQAEKDYGMELQYRRKTGIPV